MPDLTQNRLFHTLVVLGTAFGAACGSDRAASDASVGGGASGGTGGGGNTGGSPSASGGSFGGATEGVWVHYGGAGGVAGSAGSGAFIAPDCTSEQWNCDAELDLCATFDNSIRFDGVSCSCDDTRPEGEEDCAEGERLVCYRGSVDLPSPYPDKFRFMCSCAPKETACDGIRSKLEGCGDGDTRSVLYGCAYVLLR